MKIPGYLTGISPLIIGKSHPSPKIPLRLLSAFGSCSSVRTASGAGCNASVRVNLPGVHNKKTPPELDCSGGVP